MLFTLQNYQEGDMNSESTSFQTLHNAGKDFQNRVSDFASKVKDETAEVKNAVVGSLDHQCQNAAAGLRNFSRAATHYCRRHPAQSIAAALAVGFVIGRLRSQSRQGPPWPF
jgi:ElaB/YqjD/DUF883 family membrane-anchored ribosome-binding protein